MLNASLAYGTQLEEAFNAYEYSKALGNIKGSWNTWLKENVSISAQYARQLRDLSKRFKTYKVFTTWESHCLNYTQEDWKWQTC